MADPKTVDEFNTYIGSIFETVLPQSSFIGQRELTSFKYRVFDELFGKGVFGPGPAEKKLTLTDPITFEDSPTTATGIKATGFRKTTFTFGIFNIRMKIPFTFKRWA